MPRPQEFNLFIDYCNQMGRVADSESVEMDPNDPYLGCVKTGEAVVDDTILKSYACHDGDGYGWCLLGFWETLWEEEPVLIHVVDFGGDSDQPRTFWSHGKFLFDD